MSDIVLNNDGTLTIWGKIKSSIIVEVEDPNSGVFYPELGQIKNEIEDETIRPGHSIFAPRIAA
jgi:hypothetical protein